MSLHMDSYISPASWSDLSMNWGSPDAQDARFVDALCCAISERTKALGGNASLPIVRPDMPLDYTKIKTIHDATLALAPRYINHLNPKGVTFAKYGDFRSWNIHDILAAIGDACLISPQPYVLDNSAWVAQQYKILNMLRCLSISVTASGTCDERFEGWSDWPDADPQWNPGTKWSEASWTRISSTEATARMWMEYQFYDSQYNNVFGYRRRCRNLFFKSTSPLAASSSIFGLVLFVDQMNHIDTSFYHPESGMFEDKIFDEPGYYVVGDLDIPLNTATSLTMGDIEAEPPWPITNEPGYSNSQDQWWSWTINLASTSCLVTPSFKFKV